MKNKRFYCPCEIRNNLCRYDLVKKRIKKIYSIEIHELNDLTKIQIKKGVEYINEQLCIIGNKASGMNGLVFRGEPTSNYDNPCTSSLLRDEKGKKMTSKEVGP